MKIVAYLKHSFDSFIIVFLSHGHFSHLLVRMVQDMHEEYYFARRKSGTKI